VTHREKNVGAVNASPVHTRQPPGLRGAADEGRVVASTAASCSPNGVVAQNAQNLHYRTRQINGFVDGSVGVAAASASRRRRIGSRQIVANAPPTFRVLVRRDRPDLPLPPFDRVHQHG
jgi:hypothetical protein